MMLELSDAETSALRELLDETIGDLSMEIADTDNMQYRRELRERREHLEAVRSKLAQ